MRYEVHPVVRERAAAAGEPGWAYALPDVVAVLERRWAVRVEAPLAGGFSSFVARVLRADGTPAVLKVAVPDTDFAREVDTLRRADGRGYVRVLAADLDRYAVLLEALGPPLSASGLPPEEQLAVLAGLLRSAWALPRPAGAEPYDKARGLDELVRSLWSRYRGCCDERVVVEALRCAAARATAFDPARCVVVHGDAAAGNALAAPAGRAGAVDGYLLTDPDGFVGDPAYDLGVALRDWCGEVLADPGVVRRYRDVLAEHSVVDAEAICQLIMST